MRRIKWLAAAGFVATLVVYFPGNLRDNDSVDQFAQSLTHRYSDWHPVVMALVWSAFNTVWRGPQTMLILQLGLYWAAVYLLLDALPTPASPWKRLTMIGLVAAPFVLVFLDEIVKDVQLAAAWSFAAACAYRARSTGRRLSPAAIAGLLVVVAYGALLRNNASIVAGPMALYVATGRPLRTSRVKSLAAYACIGIFAVALGKGLSAAVKATPSTQLRSLLTFDLVGMSKVVGANLLPLPLTESEFARVVDGYDGSSQDFIRVGSAAFLWDLEEAAGMTNTMALRQWMKEVAAHPLAYAIHRARFVKSFALVRPDEPLSHVLASIVTKPILWTVLLVALMSWSTAVEIPESARAFVQTELITAILYLLTYVPFGVSWGFRYSYLVMTCITFGATVLLGTAAAPRGASLATAESLTPA